MTTQESWQFEQSLARIHDDRTQGAAELAWKCLRLLADSAMIIEATTLQAADHLARYLGRPVAS